MKDLIKKINKATDYIDNSINEVCGKKLPKFLEKHINKIYFIFFIITLIAIKEAYYHRGYFAVGGEMMIMLLPVMLDCYLKMRD